MFQHYHCYFFCLEQNMPLNYSNKFLLSTYEYKGYNIFL